jgi:transcriptional regulator with XRE-family HTH domain
MPQEPAAAEAALRAARGDLIRRARTRLQLTQGEVAELSKFYADVAGHEPISRSHLAYIESGQKSLSDGKLRTLAKVLGIREAHLRTPVTDFGKAA